MVAALPLRACVFERSYLSDENDPAQGKLAGNKTVCPAAAASVQYPGRSREGSLARKPPSCVRLSGASHSFSSFQVDRQTHIRKQSESVGR